MSSSQCVLKALRKHEADPGRYVGAVDPFIYQTYWERDTHSGYKKTARVKDSAADSAHDDTFTPPVSARLMEAGLLPSDSVILVQHDPSEGRFGGVPFPDKQT